ncbi:MAG TPA: Rrf2 family transcriptional regulator [Phycisphaerae bacterium]|nr:Rrf2 family transcriptional regulator [Phycisphaerae bacterium]
MIRKDTDEALRMLVHLAGRRGQTISASQLSEALNVPRSFALKILGRLVVCGLLEARAGRGGGFRFVKRPADVSMMTVIEAVQGPPLLNRCMAGSGLCSREGTCPISSKLLTIQKQLNRLLSRTTLADVVPPKPGRGKEEDEG